MNQASEFQTLRRRRVLRWLVMLNIVVVVLAGILLMQRRGRPSEQAMLAASPSTVTAFTPSAVFTPSPRPPTITPSASPAMEVIAPSVPSAAAASVPPAALQSTLAPAGQPERLIVSADENGFAHLFVLQPDSAQRRRLTDGAWDDMHPAISPDGTRLAFASNRDGKWDLYLLSFANGEVTPLTDSPEYDGHPSWSPDGLWLAYESYVEDAQGGGSLEIFIRPLDGSQAAIRLTDNLAGDYAPDWSPAGRQLAFTSDRSGDAEVWLADLDLAQDRFANLSHRAAAQDDQAAWSPDGRNLAWVSRGEDGLAQVLVWNADQPDLPPRPALMADDAAWGMDESRFAAVVNSPNAAYWTLYQADGTLAMPLLPLPGAAHGLDFAPAALADTWPAPLAQAAQTTPPPLWTLAPALDAPSAEAELGRKTIKPLEDVEAPYPALLDGIDQAFQAFRRRLALASGWDFLETLEQAYLPLTAPLTPGVKEEWAYTGRDIRFNTAAMNAGWLIVQREMYGPQTYWRVFIRARFQDGQQGRPLRGQRWDLTARFNGNPLDYERGGSFEPAPAGYWVDLTRLALAYGWQRLPALSSWRLAYSSTRFNELVYTQNLDWFQAMLQVYPRAALNTSTPVLSPTITSTSSITPTPTRQPTITRRPSFTPTATWTKRPTSTITPTWTKRPTSTPTLTRTPRPPRPATATRTPKS